MITDKPFAGPSHRFIILDRWQKGLWFVAVLATVISIALGFLNPVQFFRSYLFSYLYWFGMTMGLLAFAMIYPLVGGGWGEALKNVLLAGLRTMPLVAALFLPIAFGLSDLYEWARPAARSEANLAFKLSYLNPTFFVVRAALYFASWIILANLISRWSAASDLKQGAAPHKLRALCAAGLVYFVLSSSLATIDWLMSLEREYYSSIMGLLVLSGQILGALGFAIAAVFFLHDGKLPAAAIYPVKRAENHPIEGEKKICRDLGSLLCVTVLLWAYLQFSQFIINWNGNLPSDIPWYINRSQGGWSWLSTMVIIFHFAVPFLVLLQRPVKEYLPRLALVGLGLVIVHIAEVFWMVVPSFGETRFKLAWLDASTFIAMGATWLAMFLLLWVWDSRYISMKKAAV